MTLLSIIQDVADLVGAQRPSAVIGSSDQTARRMLAQIKLECALLVKRHHWSALIREATITTAAGTASYAVESDFDRILVDTAWDATNYWQMKGSLTPAQWQWAKRSQVAQPSNRRRFRVKWDSASLAREVFIDPTPSADDESLVYEYVSNNYCQATGGGALKSAWSVDTDVPLLPEMLLQLGLRWRYLNSRGLPYLEEKKEYNDELFRAIGADAPAPTVDLGSPPPPMFRLPDGNFTL